MPLVHLVLPRYCVVCGSRLQEEEDVMCQDCLQHLPRTGYHLIKDNVVERLFWGKFPLGWATAFYFYSPGGSYAQLVHVLKYKGRSDVGVTLGKLMAGELASCGFFEGVDVLLPVPLHPQREKSRGYNQSERLAEGVSQVTGIRVATDVVVRVKATETQTHKSAQERFENMQQVFALQAPEAALAGKHVLLMDDVLTTSATLTACADVLKDIPGITISVLALAVAGH